MAEVREREAVEEDRDSCFKTRQQKGTKKSVALCMRVCMFVGSRPFVR